MKPKTKSQTLEVLTYPERATAANTKAVKAQWNQIEAKLNKFNHDSPGVEKLLVSHVNLAREIGIGIQTACGGHEQVKLEFWKDQCPIISKLPHSRAKFFLYFANHIPQPLKSVQDLMPFMQELMITAELFAPAERDGFQVARNISPFQTFMGKFTVFKGMFARVTRDREVEYWEPTACDTALSETEWVGDLRLKVKARLLADDKWVKANPERARKLIESKA